MTTLVLVITMITIIFTRHHQQYSSMACSTLLSLQQLSKSRQTHQSLGDHCSLIVNIQGSCYNWRIGLPLNAWGEAFPVGVQCLVRSSPSYFITIFVSVLIKSSFINHGTRHSRRCTSRGFLLGIKSRFPDSSSAPCPLQPPVRQNCARIFSIRR